LTGDQVSGGRVQQLAVLILRSLPLDRRGRLGGDVVDDAVDAATTITQESRYSLPSVKSN
jgi:hypothetical protein